MAWGVCYLRAHSQYHSLGLSGVFRSNIAFLECVVGPSLEASVQNLNGHKNHLKPKVLVSGI